MGLASPRIYLDSCLVIYLVEQHRTFYQPVHRAIAQTPDAEYCISSMVELECLVGPLKLRDTDLEAAYEEFFATVTRLEVPADAFRAAAQLRADYGIRTPDALHLATALHHACEQLWTNDDRLTRVAGGVAVNVMPRSQEARDQSIGST